MEFNFEQYKKIAKAEKNNNIQVNNLSEEIYNKITEIAKKHTISRGQVIKEMISVILKS